MNVSLGSRLKAARLMAGLSMDQLVAKMQNRVSKQAISKYENGMMKPDGAVLTQLGRALSVHPEFLLSTTSVQLNGLHFRKGLSLGAKGAASFSERVKDSISRYLELELVAAVDAGYLSPFSGIRISDAPDIEKAADKFRAEWGLGRSAPVASVVGVLEDHNVRIVELGGFDGLDGLSGWADDLPFVVLGSTSATDRKRLIALHEYAHIALPFDRRIPQPERRVYCHRFAVAVLLPDEVLTCELGIRRTEISLFELASLKREYGIPMREIARRAFELGIITTYLLRRLNSEFNRRGWNKVEPHPFPADEHPFHFQRMIHRAIAHRLITVSRAAYLAGVSEEEIRRQMVLADLDADVENR